MSAPAPNGATTTAAFNLGNTGGPWLGGTVIDAGLGYPATAWAGAAMLLVGIAAVALALVALVGVAVLARRLRRLREDQQAILGGNAPDDLVAHAAGLERGFQSLNDYVQDVAQRLDGRLSEAELRVEGPAAPA